MYFFLPDNNGFYHFIKTQNTTKGVLYGVAKNGTLKSYRQCVDFLNGLMPYAAAHTKPKK